MVIKEDVYLKQNKWEINMLVQIGIFICGFALGLILATAIWERGD